MLAEADYKRTDNIRDKLSDAVIGCAIEVHRALGPGLLESAYADCLAHEMKLQGLPFQREIPIPLKYKTILIPTAYRLDFLVSNTLVLEIKAVEQLHDTHEAVAHETDA